MYNKEYHRKISLMCQEIQQKCYDWHELKKNKTPSKKIQNLLNELNSYIKWLQIEKCNYGKYINLSNLNFYKYKFNYFILNNANLNNSNFIDCDFIKTNLQKTNLNNTTFNNCKLVDIDFSKTNLIKSTFNKCKFNFKTLTITDINFPSDKNLVLEQLKSLKLNDDNIHKTVQYLYKNKLYEQIENLDVSNVTYMDYLFEHSMFRNMQLNLSKWNVSKVTMMNTMFEGCKKFNGNISKWNVSKVREMRDMFYDCISFKQNLSKWDTSNVKYNNRMFEGCHNMKEEFKPKMECT